MMQSSRREFLNSVARDAWVMPAASTLLREQAFGGKAKDLDARPNILFAISDDQSWRHTGASGDPVVKTPVFDRVARKGVRFTHAFCCSPSCTPSRGAILTGQDIWRLEEGGNLWSTLDKKFAVYPDLLEAAGYHVGFMKKGWGPGLIEPGGRTRNPAGTAYNDFEEFFKSVPAGKPFCCWFGSTDPHRAYVRGSGLDSGMSIADVQVPPFLPDVPEVRSDILDYYFAIERFDRRLGEIIGLIEKAGKLSNTMVIVTSDNGMPFPRAKCNLYDYGTRMPLAVCWQERVKGGRVIDDFISFADFAPTFLETAGLEPLPAMTGRSFLELLTSDKVGRIDPQRDRVLLARERHTLRPGGLGYPMRAIRTYDFLYIRNFEPDRWPAGDPPGYSDIDPSPTKAFIMQNRSGEVRQFFQLGFAKRPAEELYDLRKDADQLTNVAHLPEYAAAKEKLRSELLRRLVATNDPRARGEKALWDTYPIRLLRRGGK